MNDLRDILSILQAGGPTGLALISVGFLRKWIVPGILYEELRADRDAWRAKAEASAQQQQQFTEWVLRLVKDGKTA